MTHAVFALTLNHWRFYFDGTESGSSPDGSEDSALALTMGSGDLSRHVRWLLEETGAGTASGAGSDTYQLQHSLNGGAWTNVTAVSSVVKAFTGSGLSDGGATTNRATGGLTDPSGPAFLAGVQEDDDGVFTFGHGGDQFTEHVFAFTIVDADVGNGDTVDLRISYNGGDSGITHGVTLPRITITKTVTTPVSMSAAAAGSVAAGRKISKSQAGAASGAATVAAARLVPQFINALPVCAAGLTPDVTFARTVTANVGVVAGMLKGVAKTFSAAAAGTAGSARKTAKRLSGGVASAQAGVSSAVVGSESLSALANATSNLAESFTAGTGPVVQFLRTILRAILRPVLRG